MKQTIRKKTQLCDADYKKKNFYVMHIRRKEINKQNHVKRRIFCLEEYFSKEASLLIPMNVILICFINL